MTDKTQRADIPLGFRIIGGFKMVIAILLVAASFGIFKLLDKDVGALFEHLILTLHLNPENRLVNAASFYVLGIDRKHMEVFGAGTLSYALLYGVEGLGIYTGAHWAEYLIVTTTGALLPVEIYETLYHFTTIKLAVLIINLVILFYFVRQLIRERARRSAHARGE